MSTVKDILRITAIYYPMGYRKIYEHLYNEDPRNRKQLNKNSLQATLSRMKKKGLLKNYSKEWSPTPEGEELLRSRNSDIRRFFPVTKYRVRDSQKNLIIIFDVPEKKKRYREWLRSELVGFGFELVQKSVWLGPALPKEFIEYLSEVGILKYVKFFRATEKDLI